MLCWIYTYYYFFIFQLFSFYIASTLWYWMNVIATIYLYYLTFRSIIIIISDIVFYSNEIFITLYFVSSITLQLSLFLIHQMLRRRNEISVLLGCVSYIITIINLSLKKNKRNFISWYEQKEIIKDLQ